MERRGPPDAGGFLTQQEEGESSSEGWPSLEGTANTEESNSARQDGPTLSHILTIASNLPPCLAGDIHE